MNGKLLIANEPLLGHLCALLASGKRAKLRPKGKSMRPFIREESDILIIAPTTKLRRGDMVLARTDEGDYVVHRVIQTNGDRIVLAGDGNLFGRETVRRESVYGKVEAIVRNGMPRNLSTFLSRATAFGWYMLLPLRRGVWKCRHLLRRLVKTKKRNER